MDPWSIGGAIASGASAATNQDLYEKLSIIFRRKRKILVLGASGAGKTQLLSSLKDNVINTIPRSQRTQFNEKTKIIINGIPFLFIDTPGHVLYEITRREAIQEAIKSHVWGILNVVCYGYHVGDADPREAINTSGIAKEEYLEERRKIELNLLSEWAPLIDQNVTDWVITVITKADLWWRNNAAVHEYYTNRTYREALGDLPSRVQHKVLPYCSVIEPFYGSHIAVGFGNQNKNEMNNYFLKTLLSAVG